MSDVAQILGLAGPKSGANGAAASDLDQLKPSGASPAVRSKQGGGANKQKKLTGMQREVLELLESNHRASHALYQGFGKTSLKQKWQERKKSPAVKWLRKSFRNPARAGLPGESGEEGLVLSHWGKAHVEQPDYVFARFNVKCDTTSFSDAEYEAVLANHQDPMMKWTKEETDLLLKLCQRYDLRWVVVSDKYNSNPIAKTAPRSMEDIKYRYYEATRLLAEYRDKKARGELEKKVAAATPASAGAVTPAAASAAEGTLAGAATPASAAAVVAESSGTTSTPSTPVPTTPASSASEHYKFNIAYEKQRKRQLDLTFSRTVEEENEIRRLNDELRGVEQQLKKVAVRVDPKKRKELADVPYEIKRTLPTGVILRSSLLALPQQKHALSAKLLKKLQLLLDEMGVPARPMPTKPVCETFDKLRQDAVGLLSLRKHLKSKQNEVQALRERYHALTGEEYTPITTLVTLSERPGDAALADGSNSAASAANSAQNSISKGKTSKHSEKAIRAAKRRSTSSAHPGLPAKRNKKVPH
ncbi:Swr1 complex subunit Swc4 [Phytophthora cinnamomi]|uniref:Swr1 complex subunit Swc4 n=1 Tax=Phytophthora cinnamomi TaxID=4785 RepID=UPI003559AF3A|nr:Swr1 complex subunit Swc4 [Phytophthora cinnamomi]